MLALIWIRASAYAAESRYNNFRAERKSSSALLPAVKNGGIFIRIRSIGKQYTPSLVKDAGIYSRLTAMIKGSIAATVATSLLVLEVVSHMNEIQFQAEKRYQVALSIANSLLEKELITKDEYAAIHAILLKKYRPILGTLLSDIALT